MPKHFFEIGSQEAGAFQKYGTRNRAPLYVCASHVAREAKQRVQRQKAALHAMKHSLLARVLAWHVNHHVEPQRAI